MEPGRDTAWQEALLRTVPVGIVVVDKRGLIVWCNEELLAQFQYVESVLVGMRVEDLLPPRYRDGHIGLRQDYASAPTARPMGTGRSLHGRRADGSEFPLEIGLRPLETERGRLIVATVVDITPRRDAEDTFQRVIEASPCGMLVVDDAQRVQLANEQLLTTFGYTRADLLGQRVETLIPERHRTVHGDHVAGFVRDPSARAMGPGRDLTGMHRDGTEFPVEIGLSPVRLGDRQCVLATVIDVTERKRSELHLRRANADLEEFAYAASHDLRSPLRGIGDLTDWITEELGPTIAPGVANNLGRLKTRVQRMDSLIGRMLEYARAGAERSPAESIRVEDWLREQFELGDPGGRAMYQIDSQIPRMAVQVIPLGTVLRNLISNGVQHNDAVQPVIRVAVQPRGAFYHFDVIDNGPGIPSESRDRVFKLFQRLTRQKGGTGIGLALVKRIVESHGGAIFLNDRVDGQRGAQFSVLWPQTTRRADHV
jgi:PAS domain S-box-containing protein